MRASCAITIRHKVLSYICIRVHLPPRGGNEQLKVKEEERGRRALTGRGNCPQVCFPELSSVQLADSFQTSRGSRVNLPLLQTSSPLSPNSTNRRTKSRLDAITSLKNRLVPVRSCSNRSICLPGRDH